MGRQSHLASKRTEAEVIKKAPAADVAGVRDALSVPGLRPPVQKDDLRAVYYVRLYARDVYVPGNLRDPDHVVVRRPSYLIFIYLFIYKN